MSKIEKITLDDGINNSIIDTNYLCYITECVVNINNFSLNSGYTGLVLFFNTDPETVNLENQKISYFSHPPFIDRTFYAIVIEDFLTNIMDGIENRIYQRDGWKRIDQLIRDNKEITLEMVNKGVTCWLFNEKHGCFNSNSTMFDILSYFKNNNYTINIYKIEKE